MSMVDELRKAGIKIQDLPPRKLSPDDMKRHQKVQRAVRKFLIKMDNLTRSAGRSRLSFYAKSVARQDYPNQLRFQTFQKTNG